MLAAPVLDRHSQLHPGETVSTVHRNNGSDKDFPRPSTQRNFWADYETLEEDLGPQSADSPPQRPQRPSRAIYRPEMHAARKLKEEMASVPLQVKAEPRILAREPSFSRSTCTQQLVSSQNASQPEVPWESVTLNRCLFIAITILVLASGFQKLHEALHGHKVTLDEEEDQYGLILRRSGTLRHRIEPEETLWDVLLSWLPDLDDDDDDDDEDYKYEERVRKRKPKRRRVVKTLSGLRNRPLPEILLKQRKALSNIRQGNKFTEENVDLGEKDNDQKNSVENVEKVSMKNSVKKKSRKQIID
ncbi:hypothetical protein WMY93_001466 [Mugilogobius chulae]|uniref:Uncharacterized protein n=1 Tax=Mugilogobius chulae TaxID=88201 RepID=A0AAW0QAH7_9GOBI